MGLIRRKSGGKSTSKNRCRVMVPIGWTISIPPIGVAKQKHVFLGMNTTKRGTGYMTYEVFNE